MSETFKTKNLQCDIQDYTPLITDVVKTFTARAELCNSLLKKGCLDAPYIPFAASLGMENMSVDEAPVYKITTPGYFYRRHNGRSWDSSITGATGVVLASSPGGIKNTSNRLLYFAGSDGGIGHANACIPILPGTSTYAYIVRSTSRYSCREWVFVPSVWGACANILPNSYAEPVGIPDDDIGLSGSLNAISGKEIFSGDWRENFKSVCGWNVSDETSMKFIGTGAADLKTRRRTWITGLGATPSDYGY